MGHHRQKQNGSSDEVKKIYSFLILFFHFGTEPTCRSPDADYKKAGSLQGRCQLAVSVPRRENDP